ncbi:MAG: ribulose-phosphate 3-epimerase [Chloroflexota bacterium]|nr:MAG: ribulose-phosphate 3-epimerase [Chloroflexota bacterium]
MGIKIAPSILSADFARLGDQIHDAEAAGADQIHIDVMDGQFVPQISFGPPVVWALRKITALPLDVHLMVVQPERHIQAFRDAGADCLTIHYEATAHVHSVLGQIHELGCKAGLALNPHTPPEMVSQVLPLLDLIVVLAVNPGAAGQKLLPEMLTKITTLRGLAHETGHQPEISIDGGIHAGTAAAAVQAGASILIAGSAIFGSNQRIEEGVHTLRQAAISTNQPERTYA